MDPCRSIEAVEARWRDIKYMKIPQARYLRNLFREHHFERVLELGFFHGKSSAFMAAILEEMGGNGHITTMDMAAATQRTPNIDTVLGALGLSHRVTPVYSKRSFTWELHRLLAADARPSFDFCYIDGAHTWDGTGFSFLLVDLLLRPGGWVLFDDLNWTIAGSPAAARNRKLFEGYPEEERVVQQVREVWRVLVPARGYQNMNEEPKLGWGIAQKPY